jgi:hypothetical protein
MDNLGIGGNTYCRLEPARVTNFSHFRFWDNLSRGAAGGFLVKVLSWLLATSRFAGSLVGTGHFLYMC